VPALTDGTTVGLTRSPLANPARERRTSASSFPSGEPHPYHLARSPRLMTVRGPHCLGSPRQAGGRAPRARCPRQSWQFRANCICHRSFVGCWIWLLGPARLVRQMTSRMPRVGLGVPTGVGGRVGTERGLRGAVWPGRRRLSVRSTLSPPLTGPLSRASEAIVG